MSDAKPYIPFNTIRTLLPHAYPMLLVDRVTEIKPGKSGKGIKNVTFNEQILQGHFPDEPIYPGCLLLESCAQLGAIVMLADHLDQQDDGELTIPEGMESKVEYLASVERFKFLRTTVPGDQIILEARIGRAIRGLASYTVRARVGSEVAAEGTLVVTQRGDLSSQAG